ncbi:PREDICTED: succinate dehydrogenase subunit 5, mitochondrial-like [Nicotiana attenuata]|uniref:Succinate dehydrogenase subunit 5, mitochondrial n=1 Tax=Nicotiana attenuata TaxID=49451 RepID=A0A1J6IIF9_NICAT|nr:PREDICTED: succinate dehydrogenase subunit 5, mitochondrial-like [Nicotiana attenuata]OIT04132.1 succinate dehydrogenase subunit 5, mitochondrial [Nicotiana attenuata]
MEKMVLMRSLYRSICRRSTVFGAAAATTSAVNHQSLRHLHFSSQSFSASPRNPVTEWRNPFTMAIGSMRSFSEDLSHMPDIKDPEVKRAFKDLMAASWHELPDAVVYDAKNAVSKSTDDKTGQEALASVFRAAEAVEEFTGILTSLKMEIDDAIGLSGEDVKPLSKEVSDALQTVFLRYNAYMNAFGPEEGYLRKKVEMELGTRMIHLKMRCSGLDSEWGKVTVLGTSGLAGSYVEHRA